METIDEKSTEESKSPKSNNRIVIGLVALLLLFMCCCVVVLSVALVDPFDWKLLGFLSGGGDAAVDSMPESTGFYVGLDMDQLTLAELGRLVDPFLEDGQSIDYRNFAEMLADLDDELGSEMGFNISDDILPWLGPNVGIGLVDYQIDQYGGLDVAQVLVVAESRDSDAADDFVAKFIASVEDSRGDLFFQQEYEGVTIYELDTDYEDERLAIARSGDLVYFATGAEAIEDGIDAQKGNSLANNEEYSKLEREMSPDRAITIYFNSDFVGDLAGGLASDLPVDPNDVPLVGEAGGALTLSIIDPGIQVDFLAAIDQLGDEERLALEGSDAKTADMFPEDTVAYFTGASVSQYWDALMAVMPDYEEAMDELEGEIGFDIVNDLIVHLDGETGIGLWPSSEGVLADAADIALAFGALAGTSDEAAVNTTSGKIAGLLEDQFLTVDSKTSDGLTVYTLSEEFSGIEASYGVGEGYFFITSGEAAVEDVFHGDSSLADSELYKSVWSEFPGGTSPVLYLDINGFADALASAMGDFVVGDIEEATAALEPISVVAFGTDFGGDVSRASMILFLKSE
ncbi:MAG: DUF3352 domain-containing protein [Candidatus Promineifilaceae bacterium]